MDVEDWTTLLHLNYQLIFIKSLFLNAIQSLFFSLLKKNLGKRKSNLFKIRISKTNLKNNRKKAMRASPSSLR